jgi:hypothetical protein
MVDVDSFVGGVMVVVNFCDDTMILSCRIKTSFSRRNFYSKKALPKRNLDISFRDPDINICRATPG